MNESEGITPRASELPHQVGFMQFQIDTQTIIAKLDEIISLLHSMVEDPNRRLTEEEVKKEYYPLLEPIKTDGDAKGTYTRILICNCGDHKHGALTGGWHCPVHGQCF